MAGRRKNKLQWWLDRLNTLTGYKEEAMKLYDYMRKQYNIDAYEKGYWAILKLTILSYYIDVYTIVAKEHFKKILYIDLLAGCGLNKIKDYDEIIMGSALLAAKVPREGKEFDKLVLVEMDSDKARVLEDLLQRFNVDVEIINGDCNERKTLEQIESIINEEDNTHFLAFVDPEGLEVKWKTVEALLKMNGDVVINYMCSSVARTWGNYHSDKHSNKKEGFYKRLTEFFGTDEWLKVPYIEGNSEKLFELYLRQISRYKDVAIPTRVQGLKGFHYHIVVAVRKTRGSQGWLDAVYRVKRYVESTTPEEIKGIRVNLRSTHTLQK